MSNLEIKMTPLPGLVLINRKRHDDKRGFLNRIFCQKELGEAGWSTPVNQINYTMTMGKGTVRGLHYQLPPSAEMKLVTCIKGEIWDVAVDVREDSTTFLKWHAEPLGFKNNCSLLIPPGFAHGFQVISDEAEIIYLHSAAYDQERERGLNPLDKSLKINWPLPVAMMSEKDSAHEYINENFQGVIL